jgi:hypothetical protein
MGHVGLSEAVEIPLRQDLKIRARLLHGREAPRRQREINAQVFVQPFDVP